ncbi:ABC transporter substrate-binding protein [Streptomyces similanensis]|uniref:Sugar ABC transporter substrate-binding protein n=1 Tax=Streptomyces similanensis TaxID=1274988 RepID=A0ABP9KB25_9ACTN
MSAAPARSRTPLRAAAALTAAALSATLLAGCGGDGKDASAGPDKPVDITFWGWAKGTKQVVDAFNASHKDVRVRYEEIPSGAAGGYAKLSNAAKAGNAPDVFNVEYPQLPDFVSQGAVADISEYVDAGLKAKYLPQAVQLTTLGGATYALPLDAAPQVFYYRKDLFAKAGITAAPTTWAEFRADAVKLKQAQPGSRIATFFPDDPTTFEAMAWQAGAQWFGTSGDTWQVGLTGAETNKAADYWQKMIDDDLVRVEPSFSQQWTASLQKGGTAGYLGASWGGGVLKGTLPEEQAGKWAVAPLPAWNGAASGMLGGSTFAVSKDSDKVKAAVEFAAWATTTAEGIQARISSGDSSTYPADPDLVPVAAKAFKAEFYGGQDVYAVYEGAAATIGQKWTWGPAMGVTNTTLKDSFGKLADHSGTISQALAAAQKDTVAELKNRGLKVSAR